MTPSPTLELSFRDDISAIETSDGGVVLRGAQGDIPFQRLSPGWLDAMRALSVGDRTDQQLGALVLARDGMTALFYFQQALGRLMKAGLLCTTLKQGEHPLATIVPLSNQYRLHHDPPPRETPYRLSRFAYCHPEDGRMVLACPLGHAKLLLHDERALRLIAALAQPVTLSALAASVDLDEAVTATFLNFLRSAEAVTTLAEDGKTVEESNPALAQWEFHDLLFHARTRLGRHRNPYGGSFRWRDQFPPLPPVKPTPPGDGIPLDRPDLERLKQDDPPFTAVLEARRSLRDYDERPITARELGEFLFRCARVKQLYPASEGEMAVTARPYPTGGALYELELYVVVDQCAGLAPGLYHYDPLEHRLHPLDADPQLVETLLYQAWNTANRQSRPQVCLTITARFQRVQWKYQSIAYALILKHVGVLFQTMYLVATAMGLAPCALGGGDSDLFAAAAALDYYAETTVGEFVLGSKARESE